MDTSEGKIDWHFIWTIIQTIVYAISFVILVYIGIQQFKLNLQMQKENAEFEQKLEEWKQDAERKTWEEGK